MNILLDMNISPAWSSLLISAGHQSVHWSTIGGPNAPDSEILTWAKENGYVVFTHDLDFGAILASTNADAPSVIQIRTQDITPKHASKIVLSLLDYYAKDLAEGALISVNEEQSRIKFLPIHGAERDESLSDSTV